MRVNGVACDGLECDLSVGVKSATRWLIGVLQWGRGARGGTALYRQKQEACLEKRAKHMARCRFKETLRVRVTGICFRLESGRQLNFSGTIGKIPFIKLLDWGSSVHLEFRFLNCHLNSRIIACVYWCYQQVLNYEHCPRYEFGASVLPWCSETVAIWGTDTIL